MATTRDDEPAGVVECDTTSLAWLRFPGRARPLSGWEVSRRIWAEPRRRSPTGPRLWLRLPTLRLFRPRPVGAATFATARPACLACGRPGRAGPVDLGAAGAGRLLHGRLDRLSRGLVQARAGRGHGARWSRPRTSLKADQARLVQGSTPGHRRRRRMAAPLGLWRGLSDHAGSAGRRRAPGRSWMRRSRSPVPFASCGGAKADPDVPWRHGLDLALALEGPDVTFTLVRDGDHWLSRDQDLSG